MSSTCSSLESLYFLHVELFHAEETNAFPLHVLSTAYLFHIRHPPRFYNSLTRSLTQLSTVPTGKPRRKSDFSANFLGDACRLERMRGTQLRDQQMNITYAGLSKPPSRPSKSQKYQSPDQLPPTHPLRHPKPLPLNNPRPHHPQWRPPRTPLASQSLDTATTTTSTRSRCTSSPRTG